MNWKTGKLIGSYELKRMFETGGMGTVYQARHLHWDMDVALKVVKEQFTQDAAFVAGLNGRLKRGQVLASTLMWQRATTHKEWKTLSAYVVSSLKRAACLTGSTTGHSTKPRKQASFPASYMFQRALLSDSIGRTGME
jgi:serine/threonine protein kinase